MPYSKSQLRWAFATDQPFAKKWANEVSYDSLPETAKKYEDGSHVIKQPVTLEEHREALGKYREKTFGDSIMRTMFNPKNRFELRTSPFEKAHSARYQRSLPLGIEASLYGSIPTKKDPYYSGFVGGSLNKSLGNLNVGVSLDRELLSGRMKPKVNAGFVKRFEDGGEAISPPIEKGEEIKEQKEYEIALFEWKKANKLKQDSATVYDAGQNILNQINAKSPHKDFKITSTTKNQANPNAPSTEHFERGMKFLDDYTDYEKDLKVLRESKINPISYAEYDSQGNVNDYSPVPFMNSTVPNTSGYAFGYGNLPIYQKPLPMWDYPKNLYVQMQKFLKG